MNTLFPIVLLNSYRCRSFLMANRRFRIFSFKALLLVAALLALTNVPPVPRVAAANRSITLVGLVSAWNSTSVPPNPTITVTQGDVVSITLSSGDTMHQFALDVDKDGAKFIGSCPPGDTCSSVFTPSSGTSITITTASLAAGTYTYFCTFHSGMVGSFVINAPGTVGGTALRPDMLALVAPYIVLASALAFLAVGAVGAFFYGRHRKEGNRSG
jgi:plastocyanin